MRAARLVQISVLASLGFATACSGSSGGGRQADPTVAPTPSATCDFGAASVPANCLPMNIASATGLPSAASAITPVPKPVLPSEVSAGTSVLAGDSNASDASRRSATFSITIPAGARIGADVDCLGNGSVRVVTTPDSNASTNLTCNADPTLPSEIIVEAPTAQKASATYKVVLSADAGVRWGISLFSATAAVPAQ